MKRQMPVAGHTVIWLVLSRGVSFLLPQDTSVDELQAELPERQPRYLVLSYVRNHDDGRVSYPLCFIYICPSGK